MILGAPTHLTDCHCSNCDAKVTARENGLVPYYGGRLAHRYHYICDRCSKYDVFFRIIVPSDEGQQYALAQIRQALATHAAINEDGAE